MADITNPLVIVWSDEELRPMAETLTKLNVLLDDMIQAWTASVSPALSGNAGSDPLIDGRVDQGVTVLTKDDMANFVTQCLTIQTQFNGGGVMDVITKPTVKSLSSIIS